MADIRHRVGIEAPADRVYEKLATREGLEEWWTRTVAGDDCLGGRLQFLFGGEKPGAVMEVVDLQPSRRVGWRCVAGPDEWVGTQLSFDLHESDGETVVLFTHAGWREPVEFMHHCSTKWAQFVISLKSLLERGSGIPYPDDPRISRWS
jgi:uncharacterized protein YndB with AHSA1/START domain